MTTITMILIAFIAFWLGFFICALLTKNKKENDDYEILILSQLNKNLQIKVDKAEIELKKTTRQLIDMQNLVNEAKL